MIKRPRFRTPVSGVHVSDYKNLMLPAPIRSSLQTGRRHPCRYLRSQRARLTLDFIDNAGKSIERSVERKIESIFCRDDFSRCESICLKT